MSTVAILPVCAIAEPPKKASNKTVGKMILKMLFMRIGKQNRAVTSPKNLERLSELVQPEKQIAIRSGQCDGLETIDQHKRQRNRHPGV